MVTRKHSTRNVFQRHQLYRGIYARVAKRLGVDRSYVSKVASGNRKSERVTRALDQEIARIEKILKD